MLEVGNGGMTDTEYRSHFSFWALLAAPLIAGNDLRIMRPAIREILINKEVIAINQDPLGRQGQRVRKDSDREVWSKQLADGGRAVILFNRAEAEQNIVVTWEDIGYPGKIVASVRDLWQHKDLGKQAGKFGATIPPHGVVMLTVKP
jgi:alpha-galactosidase